MLAGCGENIETSNVAFTFSPPVDLKAYSLHASAVTLSWLASPDAGEASFLGYIVEVDGKEDSLSAVSLTYVADSLSAGASTFTVFAYRSDGPRSSGATIRWAPAARFDVPVTLTEFSLQDPSRHSGLDVGSQSTDPGSLPLDQIDSSVTNLMDLYLFGGSGQIESPLALWSANRFLGTLKQTKFSTVAHSSTDLDLPLSSFPDIASFVRDTVIIAHNTIYYAKVQGDNADTLYARIHVSILPGLTFPNRVVQIRISLQRAPGVFYAVAPKGIPWKQTLKMVPSTLNQYHS
jgi:hypothetical protein